MAPHAARSPDQMPILTKTLVSFEGFLQMMWCCTQASVAVGLVLLYCQHSEGGV